MGKLMLIDAAHPEETRVAVVTDQQVDDFDFETQGKEQLRGNIYLAKVTRVEPSLQAAFVEYGGNRHGFLAFSEIHPDYYELPKADREALLREAAEEAAANREEDEYDLDEDEDENADDEIDTDLSDESDDDASDGDHDASKDRAEAAEAFDETDETDAETTDDFAGDGDVEGDGAQTGSETESSETGAKAASGRRSPTRKKRPPRNSFLRKYKIQEVIRRRQVMLVQVAKEERGNKGAALTTYLSLAGRYSVLMPNTPRGGGISRKIANGADRNRLKSIVGELEMPEGMGLIVRTAGAKRTKTDIKRDYDYLIKLWDQIREKTLTSMAPCLINEEGGLVHRALRDMFDKEIEEVLIQGEAAYREAKDLAKLIMPSQSRKVKHWTDPVPVFVDHTIDEQLDSIFKPEVRLKSGGYLVINQTEALVAIDVNSGKATKERNIEQTALRTNLEAAEEACRQMRLRDLAGLVVIDFIDMDENKNNRAIEKAMKDHLKIDRARVQYGRISQFGLMEISRQRRRAGFLQATSDPCPACNGTGRVRSVESAALQLLRAIEARAATGGLKSITVEAPTDVALYLLNHKRDAFAAIEETAGFAITVTSSDSMLSGDFSVHAEKDPNAKARLKRSRRKTAPPDPADTITDLDVIDEEDEEITEADTPASTHDSDDDDESGGKRKRRRRGRRGGRRRRREDGDVETVKAVADVPELEPIDPESLTRAKGDIIPEDGGAFLDGVSLMAAEMLDNPDTAEAELAEAVAATAPGDSSDTSERQTDAAGAPKKRRRRRRGGRNRSRDTVETAPREDTVQSEEMSNEAPENAKTVQGEEPAMPAAEPAVIEDNASPKAVPVDLEDAPEPEIAPEPVVADVTTPAPEPEIKAEGPDSPTNEAPIEAPKEDKPRRRGWWNRKRA
ncbi:MAG: Rne/Rng family ribonuclease [Pseudomonadota bacterium]